MADGRVLEDGLLRHATEGSPQGGVITPCLSNIFLHHVLDEWFENEVKPRLKGNNTLVRFADDAVMVFADFHDAKRVLRVLGKRLARYELTLHPDKTRFVDFRFPRSDGKAHPGTDGTSFAFLGFCHVRGKSRKAKNVVRQLTATSVRQPARSVHSGSTKKPRPRPRALGSRSQPLSRTASATNGPF
ncbi:MAG TPA: reverse transcriptase domain-containing protein [Hyphomicrobiaceae bacterium]|nr:reverse transcriptase domain-containing protein [Hyphomicrobiaceae bacterium]